MKDLYYDLKTMINQNEIKRNQRVDMFSTSERRQQVARTLQEHPRISVQQLSSLFAVSTVTIRKDLAWLEERQLVVRTHGGAIARQSPQGEQNFDIRAQLLRDEKERIGQFAASIVPDGAAIALDASTTALALAHALRGKHELTVVTNGLRAGMELSSLPGTSVLMSGGMIRRESLSLVGSWGTAMLQRINIKTAFVGARGFTLQEGLTEVSSEEVAFKQALIEAAHEVIALVDHTKWGQVAFATFCSCDRLTGVITDKDAPEDMLTVLRDRGVTVWTV